MERSEVLTIFEQTEAMRSGHFILTSGLHSPVYFQCARVLQHPNYAQLLCGEIARHYWNESIDVVISPAVGGIIAGHEVARSLGARFVFAERDAGILTLRRGFELKRDENVLVVEDVITTGGSVREVLAICYSHEVNVVGVGSLVKRGSERIDFDVPFYALLTLEAEKYATEECPLCREGKIAPTKPGSRKVIKP